MFITDEKLVIVDNSVACVGGLDICFGRWDTRNGVMADVHPEDFSASLFLGQEYNNARIQDFQAVEKWVSNQQSRLDVPRMGEPLPAQAESYSTSPVLTGFSSLQFGTTCTR